MSDLGLCERCEERKAFKTVVVGTGIKQKVVAVCKKCIVGPRPIVNPGAKTGRNEPCPCGSGLKFKKCHGRAR